MSRAVNLSSFLYLIKDVVSEHECVARSAFHIRRRIQGQHPCRWKIISSDSGPCHAPVLRSEHPEESTIALNFYKCCRSSSSDGGKRIFLAPLRVCGPGVSTRSARWGQRAMCRRRFLPCAVPPICSGWPLVAARATGACDAYRLLGGQQLTNGKHAMPAFADRLGACDMEDVASYVFFKAPTSLWNRR